MKTIICLSLCMMTFFCAYPQNSGECVFCDLNTINQSIFASGIGTDNTATGSRSFVGGEGSSATGNYSMAFGFQASATGPSAIALGYEAKANGMYSIGIGRGSICNGGASMALGYMNVAQVESSYLFGQFLKSTSNGNVTIGMGAGTGSNYLVNNKPYSLMVGFNSTFPTLFVNSGVGSDKTGKVGIGNITAPTAKLHIKADDNEHASLKLEPTGAAKLAMITLGNSGHEITARENGDLKFTTQPGRNFVYESGNVGIGASDPTAKLQIKDGDIFIEDINRGIIMKSPDGNCWRGTLDNSGSLQFVQVNCDDLTTGEELNSNAENPKTNIYPNPAGEKVFVSINPGLTGASLEISDLAGKRVYSEKLNNAESFIDLSGYQPGMYLFRIVDGNGKLVESVRVVKQ